MSAGTRAAVVHAIQLVIEKEFDKREVYEWSKPEAGRLSTFATEAADEEVERAYGQLDEALGDFEKNIKDQL
jgi:hypothetical protein